MSSTTPSRNSGLQGPSEPLPSSLNPRAKSFTPREADWPEAPPMCSRCRNLHQDVDRRFQVREDCLWVDFELGVTCARRTLPAPAMSSYRRQLLRILSKAGNDALWVACGVKDAEEREKRTEESRGQSA